MLINFFPTRKDFQLLPVFYSGIWSPLRLNIMPQKNVNRTRMSIPINGYFYYKFFGIINAIKCEQER